MVLSHHMCGHLLAAPENSCRGTEGFEQRTDCEERGSQEAWLCGRRYRWGVRSGGV